MAMPQWFTRASVHYRRGGLRGIQRATLAKVLRQPLEVELHPAGFVHPLYVRLRTSDVWTYDQIFEDLEYALPLPPRPKTIIDAGAHIGLAAVYFAHRFPHARIVALEPERSNFGLLLKNSAPYPSIEPVHAALWSTPCQLHVIDRGLGNWAFQTTSQPLSSDKTVGRVKAVTMAQLLDERSLSGADILKIDVEGSEKEIFDHSAGWIDRIQTVVAELHDRYTPGSSTTFYEATRCFPYRWQRGENVVASREDFRAATSPEPTVTADLLRRNE